MSGILFAKSFLLGWPRLRRAGSEMTSNKNAKLGENQGTRADVQTNQELLFRIVYLGQSETRTDFGKLSCIKENVENL